MENFLTTEDTESTEKTDLCVLCVLCGESLSSGDRQLVIAIRGQILHNGPRNGYVGRLARPQTEVVGHQLGTGFLDIIGDTSVAGGVLDAEVIDAHGPDQVFGMEQLGVGVGNGPQEPALAAIGLPAL